MSHALLPAASDARLSPAGSPPPPPLVDGLAGRVTDREASRVLVTLMLGGQLCGVPVLGVRDILDEQAIAPIPLAPPDIAGSLNLRGRIVTAIDLRVRLGLPPGPQGAPRMSLVTEQGGDLYALLVDEVREVLGLPAHQFEPVPQTISPVWARHCSAVCRLDRQLLVVLDVARLLAVQPDVG